MLREFNCDTVYICLRWHRVAFWSYRRRKNKRKRKLVQGIEKSYFPDVIPSDWNDTKLNKNKDRTLFSHKVK